MRRLVISVVVSALLITIASSSMAFVQAGASPTVVSNSAAPRDDSTTVTQVSVGGNFMCALYSDGSVQCFGNDASGQTDVPSSLTSSGVASSGIYVTKIAVGGSEPDNGDASDGGEHVCALLSNESITCWGDDYYGEGVAPTFTDAIDVSSGGASSCGLEATGQVTCWGASDETDPPAGVYVSLGQSYNTNLCGVLGSGQVNCWGYDDSGVESPPVLNELADSVSSGRSAACAISADNVAQCWGSDGGSPLPTTTTGVIAWSGGDYASCIILVGGAVDCYENHLDYDFQPPSDLGPVSSISVGQYEACAVLVAGGVICWGPDVALGSPPSAPTIESAAAGNEDILVGWSTPTSPGDTPITGYTASATDGTNTFTCTTTTLGCTIDGLTNGTSYTVSVVATNDAGNSASSSTAAAAPFTNPNAPTLGTLTPANGSIAVAWSAPGFNGGSSITGYTASATDGTNTFTCTTTTLGCTIDGLTNGTSYTVSVVATNDAGNSASSSTAAAAPFTNPNAPTLGTLTPANGSIAVAWSAPGFNGGSSITGYTASATDGTNTFTCTTTTLGCTIDGLTNGTSYTVSVVATNDAGNSASSSTAAAAPFTNPNAPTLGTLTPANGSIAVAWSAPGFNGGSSITGYTASATDGTNTFTCTTTTLGCTIDGLTNGTSYTVSVVATNDAGNSASSSTAAAAPFTNPNAPTLGTLTPANGSIAVAWSAPGFNGGSSITGYTASATDGTNTFTCTTTTLGCTIDGLTNGTSYTVSVVATNDAGNSASSSTAAAAPFTNPNAPTLGTLTPANGSIAVAWSAPGFNGGSSITGYTASATDGTNTFTCTTTTLGCTIDGLTNGTSYTVSVVATNDAGNSRLSAHAILFPAASPRFTVFPHYVVSLAKHWLSVLVSGAPRGMRVLVVLGTASASCVADDYHECSVRFKPLSPGAMTISASYTHAKVLEVVRSKVYVADVSISSATVKKGKTFQVKIFMGVPNSAFLVVFGDQPARVCEVELKWHGRCCVRRRDCWKNSLSVHGRQGEWAARQSW